METDREKVLEEVFSQFLKPIRGIPFEVIIRAICSASVQRFDLADGNNCETLKLIKAAMHDTCRKVQTSPIERPRPNEVGNDMEPFVIQALRAQGLQGAAPRTKAGQGKSTGYPDIRITTGSLPIYLEVKTYAAANHRTTQRSFYLSPADDSKVYEDAHHLVVGFEIERTNNEYIPVGFIIADLYGLKCDVKFEFNSDNRRLYEESRVLAAERVARTP